MHRHVPADLLLRDDPLVQIRRRAAGKLVVARLFDPLVRLDVVAQQLRRLPRLDHTHVHVAPRPEVVEDAGLDGVGANLDRLVARAVLRPLRLEDRHGGQRARAHCHVGQFVGRAVRVDGEEAHARGVDACDDEVRADVALIAEEVLFQHCHDGHDARRPTRGECVEFEVRGDEGRGEFRIGSGAGTGTPDGRGDVMEFFAVLDIGEWLVAGCERCRG